MQKPLSKIHLCILCAVIFCVFTHTVMADSTDSDASFQEAWAISTQLEVAANYKAALEKIESVHPIDAWLGPWHARRAWLNVQMKNYSAAYSEYKNALRTDPYFIDALTGILTPIYQMNKTKELSVHSNEILNKYPSLYPAHYYFCLSQQLSKNWRPLELAAQEALKFYPISADFLIFKARAEANQGLVKNATLSYKKILVLSPNNTEATQYLTLRSKSLSNR
jgi:tetratricopeptide (TPR) repeat protein